MTLRSFDADDKDLRSLLAARPLAIATLAKIAGSATAKDADRIAASKILLHHAAAAQAGTETPLEDMTPAQMARYRRDLQARLVALSNSAQVIEGGAYIIGSDDNTDVFG